MTFDRKEELAAIEDRADGFARATMHGPLPSETGVQACVDRAYLLLEIERLKEFENDTKKKEIALRNVRRLARQLKSKLARDADLTELLDYITNVPDHLLRFCKEAGVEAQVLRGDDEPEKRASALIVGKWRLCPSHVTCRNCGVDRVEGKIREDLGAILFRCQSCAVTSEWTGTA